MYLTEITLFNVVKKQVKFKVKSYTGIFQSLVVLQLLGILFATIGTSSMSESDSFFSMTVEFYSSGIILGITAFWLIINALLLTTTAYREDDFTFVTNRLSRLWANIIFVIMLSVIGAVSSYLATNVLKVYLFMQNKELIFIDHVSITSGIISLLGLVGYYILLGSIAYTIGSIVQRNKVLAIVLSTSLIAVGTLLLQFQLDDMIAQVLFFFTNETNFALFLMKISITSSLLFLLSWSMSRNQEVRI